MSPPETLPLAPPVGLLSLRIGTIEALGSDGQMSAIRKRPIAGPIHITPTGLAGDQQADQRHHGGPDKALHHYPVEHYAAWRRELPAQAARFEIGGFGENLSTQGLLESDVCLGDLYRLGSALVQVSQGRQPCWKLNARFDLPDMAQRVRNSGRTGWYYRVIEGGWVSPADSLALLDRSHPEWPLARVWRTLFLDPPERAALASLAELTVLASSWRSRAGDRLAVS